MSVDPQQMIVTESACFACGVHSVLVHHRNFPELRADGPSAEKAAEYLAKLLRSTLEAVQDPRRREPIQKALNDTQAFLDREGRAHPGRDVQGPQSS